MDVVWNKPLWFCTFDGQHRMKKINYFPCMILTRIVKVQAAMLRFNTKRIFMCLVLQHQLLQIVKGFFVFGTLPHLDQTFPKILCFSAMAIVTHLICYGKFNNKHLLQCCTTKYFFVYSQFHFNTLWMWFGPNKARINQFQFFKAFQFFEAQR